MSALQKLQAKIEQWHKDQETLKMQNRNLKSQLDIVASAHESQHTLLKELEAKTLECNLLQKKVETLTQEMEEKDDEIEKIIIQVESLLI